MATSFNTEKNVFIEEAGEHLSGLEHDLMAIEQGGIDDNISLVNKVFRAIHAIYGGAILFGLENVRKLSHVTGNLLQVLKSNPSPENATVFSILLEAIDRLRSLTSDTIAEGQADISEQLVTLDGMIAYLLPDSRKEAISKFVDVSAPKGTPTFSVSEFDVIHAVSDDLHLYVLRYDVKTDIASKDHTLSDVIKEIQQVGFLLDCNSHTGSKKAVKRSSVSKRPTNLNVFFATILEPEMVETLSGLPKEKIIELSTDDLPISVDNPVESTDAADEFSELDREIEKFHAEQENQDSGIGDSGSESVEALPPKNDFKSPDSLQLIEESVSSIEQIQKEPQESSKPVNSSGKLKQSSSSQSPRVQSLAASTLRVNVKLLDTLMTMAGELVLTRNQLLQSVNSKDIAAVERISQRVDLITSELQEAIMSTRMQPIGNVFSKFNRVVRDLSRDLGKEINLVIEGEDVELDKTIIEAINDPLTHLIRNAVDHGMETRDQRKEAGKSETGLLKLSAYHAAGQVIIEIIDDGAGIDPERIKSKALENGMFERSELDSMSEKDLVQIILKPGFSTAEEVTDISGRGVGMDVVHTNLTKLGGIIDIDSEVGKGTTIRIKLPLTLAIIPSLLISAENERFAVPQVSLIELVRISPAQINNRIESIGEALVMRLRGELLPLIRLRDVLGITLPGTSDPEPKTTEEASLGSGEDIANEKSDSLSTADSSVSNPEDRKATESKSHAANIAVVSAGNFHYGLIVDELLDMEEIVVKPLGYHLGGCKENAGATILGDGRVALILDVVGVSKMMNVQTLDDARNDLNDTEKEKRSSRNDGNALLIVENAPTERFAFPLALVTRIERISRDDIQELGGLNVIKYRGGSLPLFSIEDVAKVTPLGDKKELFAIIFTVGGREIGILVSELVDIVDESQEIDEATFCQPGIAGSATIMDTITLIVDPFGIVSTSRPDWKLEHTNSKIANNSTVMVVEDSPFFRKQIVTFIKDVGYDVVDADDGLAAWEILKSGNQDVDLVLTDIEMPNLDGLGLTRKIRDDASLGQMPIIAVTSLAGEEDEAKAVAAGVNKYMVKLDRDAVVNELRRLVPRKGPIALAS